METEKERSILYNADYDTDIQRLFSAYGWGAYRIYQELNRVYFESPISLPTIARRVRALKQQKGNT